MIEQCTQFKKERRRKMENTQSEIRKVKEKETVFASTLRDFLFKDSLGSCLQSEKPRRQINEEAIIYWLSAAGTASSAPITEQTQEQEQVRSAVFPL